MKLTIESTDELTTINGVLCRIWEGTTERGVRCMVFVRSMAIHLDECPEEFAAEMMEMPEPAEARVTTLREVLHRDMAAREVPK